MSIIETAKAYRGAGLSVVPIAHGDKRPACNWKRYERELTELKQN